MVKKRIKKSRSLFIFSKVGRKLFSGQIAKMIFKDQINIF